MGRRFGRLTPLLLLLLALPAGRLATGAPEKPRLGGVYIKNNIYSEPISMDPIFALGAPTIMVQMNIFDGLVRVSPNRNVVEPDIAERWTHSPDAKTFTFYLRKGIRYHDGSEVTAADFKFQLERVANPANLSPHMARLAGVVGFKAFQEKRAPGIAGITVVDKYTLRITMDRSNLLLPYYLTGVWASAVPRPAVERLGKDFGIRPVGSGPFVFESWTRGRELTLRKFPDYWRTDQWGTRFPYVDKVVHRNIRDMAAVEAEIAAGTIDSSWIRDSAYVKYKAHPLYKKNLVEGVEFYTHHLGFNLETPGVPWADRRVRQAINYAIDRRAIVDVVRHGLAYAATGALPQMLEGPPATGGYAYNPEKARQLLVEAGYPKGFSVTILTYDSPAPVAVSEAVLGYLEAIGVRARLEVLDATAARVRREQGRFEWYYGSLGGEGHPLIFMQRGFHSRYIGPAGNWTRYRSPRVDQLLDRAAEARDAATMRRLIRTAEALIVDDAPWVFLTFNKAAVVHQPYMRGLRATPIDLDWQPLEEVWQAWPPARR